MPQADAKRLKQLEQRAQAIGIELIPQLRRALRTLLLSGKRTGNQVAQMLSMHRRTLNRRLGASGRMQTARVMRSEPGFG
jgi:hypothetical protein